MGFSRKEYWSGLPCPPPGHVLMGKFLGWGPDLIASSFPPCSLGAPAPCVPMVGVGVSAVLWMAVPVTPVISLPQ